MISIRLLAGVALLAIASTPSTVGAQNIDKYRPVTQERLINPEPQNWLMYRGSYKAGATARSSRSTPANVKKLVPVWSFSTGVNEGHQAPPIVNNGIMFVTTPQQQVLALECQDRGLAVAIQAELPEDLFQLASDESRRRTLRRQGLPRDRRCASGRARRARRARWCGTPTVDEYKNGYYFTLAPLIAKGKVMVGTSGGEFGIRGYIAAFDAATGKTVWRPTRFPGPGEPGHETWPGETWKTGGVSVWITGHYDPQLGLDLLGHRQCGRPGWATCSPATTSIRPR